MPRVRVKIVALKDRDDFAYRWRDPVTRRWRQRNAETANRRKAETGRARLEAKLSGLNEVEECTFETFETRYSDEWLASLSGNTRVTSDSAFKQVKKHLNPRFLGDITPDLMMLLESRMRDEGLKDATIRGYLSHFRAALSWAESVGLIDSVPTPKRRRTRKPMSTRGRSRAVTGEEFERMLAAVHHIRPRDVPAWQYYLRGLWLSGLRLSESLELSWDDNAELSIDLSGERPRLRIWSEGDKGRKDRLLPIVPDFAEFLMETPVDDRHDKVFKLVGSFKGRALSAKSVGDDIRDIGKKANVFVNRQSEKYASAHDLRRSFGTRWSARVMPAVLKELMRHEAIETTMAYYVTHQVDDLSRDLWAKFGPRSAEGDKTGDKKKPSKRRTHGTK